MKLNGHWEAQWRILRVPLHRRVENDALILNPSLHSALDDSEMGNVISHNGIFEVRQDLDILRGDVEVRQQRDDAGVHEKVDQIHILVTIRIGEPDVEGLRRSGT